ncbi:MAG TPA: hypothetical protein VD907_00230 [Verrucomicrobiae bacterium]|nr:hypothetical protein [Verrucomicrobiae bacterium]
MSTVDLSWADAAAAVSFLLQTALAILIVGGLWLVLNRITSFNDHHEIMVRRNWPYLVQRLGVLLAHIIGATACFDFSGRISGVFVAFMGLLWVTVVLVVAYLVIERYLGRTPRLHDAHKDNMGISITKAAAFVMVGLILNGALSGSTPSTEIAISATVTFTALGLIAAFGGVKLRNLREHQNLLAASRSGKLAASFELTGVLLAMGILLRNAIAGDFVSWSAALIGFGLTFVISMVLLYPLRAISNRVIFHYCSVSEAQREDAEVPAAAMAGVLVGVAVLVSSIVTPIVNLLN